MEFYAPVQLSYIPKSRRKKYLVEQYPTIVKIIQNEPIVAFDKIDGSNIRAEWTKKNGFFKFGSRTRLLDPSEEPLGEAIPLLMEKYSDDLSAIFSKQRLEKATAFFEFYGAHSFAGYHEDEPHTVTLIDIHHHKKGFLTVKDFIKIYVDKVETPEILYEGKANDDFIRSVQDGTLEGMTFEGVVCRGGFDKKNRRVMFKIKNREWLNQLKNKCGDNQKLFEQLS